MLHIEILSERLFSYALLPPVKYIYANPSIITHKWYTTAVLYSTLSQCLQVKKNVQQQPWFEVDENKEQTATEQGLHLQDSDSKTL